MDGILIVNKPKGITSYDVIRKAKKELKTKKIGHTGTLDPFAEGLLILCIGKATKLVNTFMGKDKRYIGTVKLGTHYDTYDVTGNIVKSCCSNYDLDDLYYTVSSFKGEYYQEPPMYSALKKDGKKLYEYAREGIEIKREKRLVEIKEIELVNHNLLENEFTINTLVSKGTYIRSLAVDIADKLNTYGALKRLIRTEIGKYSLDDAVNYDDISIDSVISLSELFSDYYKLELNDYLIKLVKNGIYLDERQIETDKPFVVVDSNQNMIAYYEVVDKNKYRPRIIF